MMYVCPSFQLSRMGCQFVKKSQKKSELVQKFPRVVVTGVPIFSLKDNSTRSQDLQIFEKKCIICRTCLLPDAELCVWWLFVPSSDVCHCRMTLKLLWSRFFFADFHIKSQNVWFTVCRSSSSTAVPSEKIFRVCQKAVIFLFQKNRF